MRRKIVFCFMALFCIAAIAFTGSDVNAASRKALSNKSSGMPSDNVYTAKVTAVSGLNLRSTMSLTENNVITVIPYEKVVSILSREADSWIKADYKGTVGYVKGGFLADNPDVANTTIQQLKLRSSMDSSITTNIITEMPLDAKVEIIERTNSTWYYVNYQGKTGYAGAAYLKVKEIPKTIDLKNVKFNNIYVYYDGRYHSVPRVSNLPKDVKVTYSTSARHKDIGVYPVTAQFSAVKSIDKLINAEKRTARLTIGIKKGAVYTVGRYKVRILNNNVRGSGTIKLLGYTNKSVSKLVLPRDLKIGGVNFTNVQVGKRAFRKYQNLKKVYVPNSVKIIGSEAFSDCGKLEYVKVGTGLQTMGYRVFAYDKKLKNIIFRSEKIKKTGSKIFKGIAKKAVIKVPKKKLKKYKKLFAKKGQGSGVVIK